MTIFFVTCFFYLKIIVCVDTDDGKMDFVASLKNKQKKKPFFFKIRSFSFKQNGAEKQKERTKKGNKQTKKKKNIIEC